VGEQLGGSIMYSTDLFEPQTIKRLVGHFEKLLAGVVANPELICSALPLLNEAERQQLLVEWNETETAYPRERTVRRLFEEQVEKTPGAVAVDYADGRLTYDELNKRANQLAHHLRHSGVGAESLVGICMERSAAMIVGLIGILKAGGAYVPLDAEYPLERLAYMLEDAQISVLVTQARLLGNLPAHWGQVVCLDSDWEEIARQSTENEAARTVSAENLAYVIYTSGSTGAPKGICITHRAISRLVCATNYIQLQPRDHVAQASNASFDAATFEIWGALLHGALLVGVSREVALSPERLTALLTEQQISVLFLTTALFNQMAGHDAGAFRQVKHLLFGGEKVDVQWVRRVLEAEGRPQRLLHVYGPTESTTYASWMEVLDAHAEALTVPIGKPLSNTQLYVLDTQQQLVPLGVVGELCIGGDGLARGYLRQPALTAEKFMPHPFCAEPGERLYRTGDRVRYLPGGNLEFIGRADKQVKVRGFRLELGEIETVLSEHDAVREVAVVAREDEPGEKRLVAYLVADEENAPTVSELRRYMLEKLPEYMVPAVYVRLSEMPLTPNGKINRSELPVPEQTRPELTESFTAPRTRTERLLADVWSEVLHVEQVGIHDNFFDLGGDSILSIQVVSRAQEEHALSFSIQQLFQNPTVHELAESLINEQTSARGRIEPFSLISREDRERLPSEVEDAYPLTMLQAGMIFHSEYSPETSVYHDIFSYELRAPLDVEAMRAAMREMMRRHAALRTSFDLAGYSEPLQLAHREIEPVIEFADLAGLDEAGQQEALEAVVAAERRRHFQWNRAPLMRLLLHRRSREVFQFTLSFHHVLLDGWSLATLLTELFRHYWYLLGKTKTDIEEAPELAFREFVALEREAVESAECRQYWQSQLAENSVTVLPRWPTVIKPKTIEEAMLAQSVTIPATISEKLKNLAREAKVPLKSVLLSAHLRVLSLVSGQLDVTTGLGWNGRPEAPGGEQVLGLFLNALPFRRELRGGTWHELVRDVFATEQEMLAYRRYPLVELQRQQGGESLFEVAFNFVHFHVLKGVLRLDGIEVISETSITETNVTLLLDCWVEPRTSQVKMELKYDAAELSTEQVSAFSGYYARVLEVMATDPLGRYENFSPLSEREKLQLLIEWNQTGRDHAPDSCIHHLFEAQAERSHDSTALIFEDQQLTYRELDRRANQLARYLRQRGTGTESLVGILFDRSVEMIVGILGVLKAGGAYLPLDPQYPVQRLRFMIEDAQVRVLLTQASLVEVAADLLVETVRLDREWEEIAQHSEEEISSSGVRPSHLAYVIYTSGSTGQPKGVMVEHRGLLNMSQAQVHTFQVQPDDRVLQFASLSFDASVFEICMALGAGATLCLTSKERQQSIDGLFELMREQAITNVTLPPSVLEVLPSKGMNGLKTVISAGEACAAQVVREWAAGRRFFNAYGPTETTIWATVARCRENGEAPTIGRPINNTQIYILDDHLNPAPVGVPGHLHIAGPGLSRGYLRRPALTAEKFIPHPFSEQAGARLYRTGDVARYLPDGNIELSGRIDHQVKIRGYRIELGEIEAALTEHEAVKKAVVLGHEDTQGSKRLVAYVVADANATLVDAELRSYLKQRLPDHMIPTVFVQLAEIPLTPNGKVDRRALPAPERTRSESAEYVPPRTAAEQTLARIWSEVLRLEQVSIHDNFFELGGDSILSIQVISRANRAGLKLTPRQLFEQPSVAALASVVGSIAVAQAEQGLVTGEVKLTPIQHWFFEQEMVDPHHFNQAVMLAVPSDLDLSLFEQAVKHLLMHHDALRLRFHRRAEGGWQQLNAEVEESQVFEVREIRAETVEERGQAIYQATTEAQRSLDIEGGPLLRVVYFDLGDDSAGGARLLIVIHHLAVDGVSWRILLEDLRAAYEQLSRQEAVVLPSKTTSYQQWARHLMEYAESAELEQEIDYWTDERWQQVKPLPVDIAGAENTRQSMSIVTVTLDAEQTRALVQEVPQVYHTQINDLLLTALALTLIRWSGGQIALIDLEGHGREDIFEMVDVSRTVGWFTSIFPVLLGIKEPQDGEGREATAIKGVKEQMRGVPRRGIGYGLLKYLSRDVSTGERLKAQPQAEVSFNYLGQVDQVLGESSLFAMASEPGGPTQSHSGRRSYLLEINAIISGGELSLSWSYSSNLHRQQTIEALAADYIHQLQQLIIHCQSPQAGGYTPSDFPDVELSQEELDELLTELQ
jgi:amino acid adenylation domain-containing protein/non-ribosomal peptide synthase protein (TIGR01720 family)